jgi:UDP-galactopyranose mutase
MTRTVLIVGAGFAGAVHARELAEAGYAVQVIDRRPHIAGNAYDEAVPTGQRVHRYGPHLFHTNNQTVIDWITRFADFVPYEHRVQALLPDGRAVPLPVGRLTINAVFGTRLRTEADVQDFLRGNAEPIAHPANAAEHLMAQIGRTLTDLFFRPYSEKMWGIALEDMDAAIVRRVPVRADDEDRYFPADRFQAMPRDGYTALFQRILDHPNIRVALSTAFDRTMPAGHAHCFNSMAIDAYFDDAFGPLPYRSLRFHHRSMPPDYALGTAVQMNFTDAGIFTRETDWSRLPAHRLRETGSRTVTLEEPCDYRDNAMERYYPVKTSDGRFDAAYARYKALAAREGRMSFIGRCGTYQYLDMHQVINQSLMSARAWIAANPLTR